MSQKLSSHLSKGRVTELFKLSKLKILSIDEELLDKSYLESMIALAAAKIDIIQSNHLLPATHVFNLTKRLRPDHVTESAYFYKIYQTLAPMMLEKLFCVPTVIE